MQDLPSDPRYDELPEPCKAIVTPGEWAWLSDSEKIRFVQTQTEPDPEP